MQSDPFFATSQLTASHMNAMAWGFAVAAAAYLTLSLALLARRLRDPSSGLSDEVLVAALFVSALWAVSGLWASVSGGLAARISMVIVDMARYGAWFAFLWRVISGGRGTSLLSSPLGWLAIGLPIVVLALSLGDTAGWLGKGQLSVVLPLANLALPVFGLVLLEQLVRSVPNDFRWHAKPLALALLSLFVFDIYLHSQFILTGGYDEATSVVRAPISVVACLLFFMTARRHAAWMVRLHMSHTVALHTTTLVLVGAYLIFISAVGYYVQRFGGEAGRALQVGILAMALVALVVVLASASLRAKLQVTIRKNFFSYRYDYRTEWLRFTAMLTGSGSSREVGSLVIRGLADLLQCKGGALWLPGSDPQTLVQAVAWNMAPSKHVESATSTFSRFILEREWIVDLDEMRSMPTRYDELQAPDWLMAVPNCWLVVPLIVGEHLVGFVMLSQAVGVARLDWEARDLLKTAARQAAGFLSQVQATDALLEARKFDAFNRMSAFVVHDLKNIVTQLSLMMQNARRLQDNPEFRQDMLVTVEHSLEKMRQLMLQLRDGAVPAGATLGVDLGQILRSIQAMVRDRGRSCNVDISEPLVARGHEERIARVIGHVVQNALDATPPEGFVSARLVRTGGRASIVVSDNGQGMSEEFIRNRLFKPFNTTKESGMGIGAYESFQYVRELGGSIEVESELGSGTTITIQLPLFDIQPSRRSELMDAA